MQSRCMTVIFSGIVALSGVTAHAEFRVADLIYVPVVAHVEGANGSVWRSDVTITNVETEDSIDVAMVLLPSGLRNNSYLFADREDWVGGRESDSFGIIEERLANIPPGGTVFLEDVVGAYWPEHTGLNGQGALVVFAYLADSLEDDGSREYRNMAVGSRTYTTTTIFEEDPDNEGEYLEKEVTYGQQIAGVPWYNLADSAFVSDQGDFTFFLLNSVREDDAFRYNLGIVNTSDRQTSIVVRIEPIQEDGQPFLGEETGDPKALIVTLPPLAHVQYFQIMQTSFGLNDVAHARLKVSLIQWSTTGTDPHPTFTTYGSLIDNNSNDPSTDEPTFETPYNIDCMWPTVDDGEPKSQGGVRRALDVPGLW